MRRFIRDGSVVRQCDGVEDFIAHAMPNVSEDKAWNRPSHHTGDWQTEWSGTATFDEAIKLLRGGWDEGRQRVAELSSEVSKAIGNPAPELTMTPDVQGGAIDMGAFMSGEPECMVTWADQEGAHQLVHFVVNTTASASVSANALLARGALIAATIDALETAGHRCTVDVVSAAQSKKRYEVWCRVKDAQDPLDIERLAFTVAHPSHLRRLVFGHVENDPEAADLGAHGSFGTPQSIAKAHRGDVYIPGLSGSDPSEWPISKAVAECMKWIAQAGVELETE